MLYAILLAATLLQTPANPCDVNTLPPFIVTSARAFTVIWCTPTTRNDNGNIVPERINGFYLKIDTGTRIDIGMATSLGTSVITNRNAWQYIVQAGVAKGEHTAAVTSWNFLLDANGLPTTQRVEATPTAIPFTAVDPVSSLAPLPVTGLRVIKQ